VDIIRDSVKKIRDILEHGGCGEGNVMLEVNPDMKNCQFEKGACMTASFGGRTADFITFDPIRARTKISFMYDAPLDTPSTRGAASAIVNVVTGFFCLTRVLHACQESSHSACLGELKQEIGGKKIYFLGNVPENERQFGAIIVPDPDIAEVILIGGEGIIAPGAGELIEQYKGKKQVLLIGPSVAGVARLYQLEHWCPYGRSS
jgi:hypothetical protein